MGEAGRESQSFFQVTYGFHLGSRCHEIAPLAHEFVTRSLEGQHPKPIYTFLDMTSFLEGPHARTEWELDDGSHTTTGSRRRGRQRVLAVTFGRRSEE